MQSLTNPHEDSPYQGCQSLAELFVVGNHLVGPEMLRLVLENVPAPRESLQRAATELRRGKASADLVAMVSEIAKTMPRAKHPPFEQRWKVKRRRLTYNP
jgi:hypothetical protein